MQSMLLLFRFLPCSPLLRGDGPETRCWRRVPDPVPDLAGPSYGAMALKLCSDHQRSAARALAVPSYGAMALKQRLPSPAAMRPPTLAAPSYGAMALKLPRCTVRPMISITCSPLLRGDGPETRDERAVDQRITNLQSPPTGRW